MDLIQREEAQKDPSRGMGGLRSPQANEGVDRDDKDVTNPFKRYRPDDTRKKWANKDLDFDDLYVDIWWNIPQGYPCPFSLCLRQTPIFLLCLLLCSTQAGNEYIVQQGKRRHVRLASVVGQARTMQKLIITNDNRRVTVYVLYPP